MCLLRCFVLLIENLLEQGAVAIQKSWGLDNKLAIVVEVAEVLAARRADALNCQYGFCTGDASILPPILALPLGLWRMLPKLLAWLYSMRSPLNSTVLAASSSCQRRIGSLSCAMHQTQEIVQCLDMTHCTGIAKLLASG
jgi:hypothetical protein